jgi:hypothetical protein
VDKLPVKFISPGGTVKFADGKLNDPLDSVTLKFGNGVENEKLKLGNIVEKFQGTNVAVELKLNEKFAATVEGKEENEKLPNGKLELKFGATVEKLNVGVEKLPDGNEKLAFG